MANKHAKSRPLPPSSDAVPTPDDGDESRSLHGLQDRLGYRFRDIDRLELALTHSSVAYEQRIAHSATDDNEQLEFLGDAVLGLVVAECLFRFYPELAEGPLTRLRAQFVSRQHLGRVGQRLALGDCLRLGKGEEKSGGRKKAALLANAVEAIAAAIYLDGGLEPAARFARQWVLDETVEELAAAARLGNDVSDHKSRLQEYFQTHGLGQPQYAVTAESGPDHRKSFVVAVMFPSHSDTAEVVASAAGTRKKFAEQEAARLALEHFRKLGPSGDTIERPEHS